MRPPWKAVLLRSFLRSVNHVSVSNNTLQKRSKSLKKNLNRRFLRVIRRNKQFFLFRFSYFFFFCVFPALQDDPSCCSCTLCNMLVGKQLFYGLPGYGICNDLGGLHKMVFLAKIASVRRSSRRGGFPNCTTQPNPFEINSHPHSPRHR